MRSALAILLGFALLAGAGCGFHLRGTEGVPLAQVLPEVYIEGADIGVGFGELLADSLRANHVRVLKARDAARPVLNLSPLRESRLVVSVDSELRVREYALISELNYQLLPAGRTGEVPNQLAQVRRDLVNDPLQVLGSDREARRLRREMHQELAHVLTLRLRLHSLQ
ncbi:MAG: LPS assembly lipoprotein LptE [Thiotrichales bacterium]